MAMEREERDEGEEGGAFLDEGNANLQEEVDVVRGIFSVIERVARFGDFRRTQRKECYNLVRRMKLLLPLLEEIREIDTSISDSAHNWLCILKKALVLTKELLQLCNEGSKIYLALENEAIMIKFRDVYEVLSQAFGSLPTEELDLSDEVKEQLELMAVQLGRAKRRTDTQDIELAVDVMVLLSNKDDQQAERAIVERLAKKLDLQTVEDLKIETVAVQSLSTVRGGPSTETTQQILELLNKFKRVAGMEETKALDGRVVNKKLMRSASLVIPHEFLCPITLEIMTDPVIIGSGQTYERDSIQKWFDNNHRTCPKTRQNLEHLSIAPNYALKNIIMQWCDTNKFNPLKKNPSSDQGSPDNEKKEDISSLVQELSSVHLDVQRKAVSGIRLLSKENSESRIMIARSGGIPPLIKLLSYPDPKIQEHAVTALLNLSIDESNKKLISSDGAIAAIIEVLAQGSVEARENSAAALFSLSMLDENKVLIAQLNGIPPLIDLLKEGTIRGKKDALTALFNLTLDHANKANAVSAGIVTPLLKLLKDQNLGMIDEALSIFLLLALHPDGRKAIGQLSFIETLVEFIREGTPKNKECAVSVLLELGSNNSYFILAALQFGVFEHLVKLKENGTTRGQRKANALLNLVSRSEQL